MFHYVTVDTLLCVVVYCCCGLVRGGVQKLSELRPALVVTPSFPRAVQPSV